MDVLIAPDSFKGSATAREVSRYIAAGWRDVRPNDHLVLAPQGDGGEGTLDAIETAVTGAVRNRARAVSGPDGTPVDADWLLLPDGTAVIELAQSSGLPLMRQLDALHASTRGLGETLRLAMATRPASILIALGGSASTDGGAGALAALGVEFLDSTGARLADGGADLERLTSVQLEELIPPPAGGVKLLTDVAAPLLGAEGAAAVYGPQKGADPAMVDNLERSLSRLAAVVGGNPDLPGAGAAGGTAFGLNALWGAIPVPGFDFIASLTGIAEVVQRADIVLTGEGRFDSQSLDGKVVGQILQIARQSGVRAGVIAGQFAAPVDVWNVSLAEVAGDANAAFSSPEEFLVEAGRRAARNASTPAG